jgi:hypothetical protein
VAALLLAFGFLISCIPSTVSGAPAQVTGSFYVVVPSSQGTSSYTVVWSYPASVEWGKAVNFSASLFVDTLTGLKLFVDTYELSAFVDLPGKGFVGQGNVTSNIGCDRPKGCGSPLIYPGAHWGPENMTLQIGSPGSASPQEVTNASVSFGFLTTVWYDSPVLHDYQDSGSKVVGNLTITPSGNAPAGSPLAFVGFVALGGFMGPIVVYAISRGVRRPSRKATDFGFL